MTAVAIPAWNAQGVIPPINELNPTAAERSPYVVSLTDLVLHFGSTLERRAVIEGFLRYRAALHEVGLTQGFQWLDGSFLEHVEMMEARAPNDIDIVTFYRLPAGRSQRDLRLQAPELFPTNGAEHQHLKATYRVDAYVVHLGMTAERLVERGTYWYSMWSHRRNLMWKGYLQIDLAPSEDAAATGALGGLTNQGMQP
jgi:uncharacterized protein DUF6932